MSNELEPWQEAFVKEKIWPEVLDWYLYRFWAAFAPDEKPKKWAKDKEYNILVTVGRPGIISHTLHVPVSPDHAKRIDVLFKRFGNPTTSRRLTVREYFMGTALVVWDEKVCNTTPSTSV